VRDPARFTTLGGTGDLATHGMVEMPDPPSSMLDKAIERLIVGARAARVRRARTSPPSWRR
jgi:hypothetical protein